MTQIPLTQEKAYSQAVKSAIKSNFSEFTLDNLFQSEQALQDEYEHTIKYAGMNQQEKQKAMQDDYDEMCACNDVYDYYND